MDRYGTNSDYMEIQPESILIKHTRSVLTWKQNSNITVFYGDITAVVFEEPKLLSLGFIEIKCAGNNYSTGAGNVYENPYVVTISSKNDRPAALAFKNRIEEKMKQAKAKNGSNPKNSDLDELLKLKQLLDLGAITKTEYEAKKAQLLKL